MAVTPQVSIRMNSAYRQEGGGFVPLKATLEGRTLELRAGLLSSVKVNVDDLREALAVLEAALPASADAAIDREARLQSKLDQAAAAIGLQPGGGSDGYLIPNLEKLVDERDHLREAITRHREAIDAAGPVHVLASDVPASEIKHAADRVLWALVDGRKEGGT